MKKRDFKVGDKVKITNPGNAYTTHSAMFFKLGFRNQDKNRAWEIGTMGEIFEITLYDIFNPITLLALRDEDGNECLISTEGVEFILEQGNKITKRYSYISV